MSAKSWLAGLPPAAKARVLWIAVVALPLTLGFFDQVNPSQVVNTPFLIEYLGMGLGILIAVAALMLDLIGRLSVRLDSDYRRVVSTSKETATALLKARDILGSITAGLKNSLLLMLGFLTVCITVGYVESLSLPEYLFYIPTPLEITVPQLLTCIKYIVLGGSVIVMYLVIRALFRLFDASSVVMKSPRL